MFKMKAKNHTMKSFRKSLMQGRNIISDRMSDGMKYAQHQIVDIADYMRKNPGLEFFNKRIMKNPSNGLMTLAGLGLVAYGIFRMMRK